MTGERASPSLVMLLVIGFIVWSVAFVALYGINAIGCAFGWDPALQRLVLVGLLLAHAVAIGWIASGLLRTKRNSGEAESMLRYAGLGLTLAALASTIAVFAPSLFLTMCV